MLPYFPFPPTFDLKMGTAPLVQDHPLVEIDARYHDEISQKRKLLDELPLYYYQSQPDTTSAQWEVVEKIATNLSVTHPGSFRLVKDDNRWTLENKLLDESHAFTIGNNSSLPLEPLDWIGRQVQEDLIILSPASHLVAGQLCFPSGWCLDEKFGRHFLELHAPLPSLMAPMLQAADKLIERIPVGKPIARTNWGFRVSDQLDLASRHGEAYRKILEDVSAGLTAENAGDHLFLRIERQTLSRLPATGHVLFTIHTYNNLVREEIKDANRLKGMLSFLRTVPAELFEYKQMSPFARILVEYLEKKS